MKRLHFTLAVLFLLATSMVGRALSAEAEEDEKKGVEAGVVKAAVAKEESESESRPQTGIARLMKKFTRADGSITPIAVLTPLDYTTLNFTGLAQETIVNAIGRYGKFEVQIIDYSPAALTLEEFRKVVTRFNVDIVVLSVLKPTNFDLFLYDRRTPYNIYAHSELLPEAVQYQLTKEVVEEYTKVIVRRVLFAYMQDQFYELPREEARPFLNAEIPRFIASGQSFKTVNREILSRFYAAVSVGAALSAGGSSMWTSNLVNLQVGAKLFSNYFAELNLDMFAYNSFGASMKYMFSNRESPFRFIGGIGLATMFNSHTINYDQTNSQGTGGNYIVPSASFTFPIVEIHFKVETKLFVSLDGSKFVAAVMPGMMFMF